MAILQRHIPFHREMLAIPGLLSEPVLLFGFQEIRVHPLYFQRWSELGLRAKWGKLRRSLRRSWDAVRGVGHTDLEVPEEFRVPDLGALLRNRGIQEIEVLDRFDPRATLRYDMNAPVPEAEHGRYGSLIDIGCLEHVFDTRQCLENCLRMVRTGGFYLLNTPVNGYLGHGLHVFNPEAIIGALSINGFEILYHRYSTVRGAPLDDPSRGRDVLIYIAARKLRELRRFEVPQQGLWSEAYRQFE